MAKKKTEGTSPAKPRAAAAGRRAPRKVTASTEAAPIDPAGVSAAQPIDVAADMSMPGTPEGIVDATSPAPVIATTINPPTHDEIAEAAYHRYKQRGGGHGMDFEDWLEAERALRSGR
jgi:hypothetical protein